MEKKFRRWLIKKKFELERELSSEKKAIEDLSKRFLKANSFTQEVKGLEKVIFYIQK